MSDDGRTLTKEDLSQLPSRREYKELVEQAEKFNDRTCAPLVKYEIGNYTDDGSVKDQIIKALCYIHKMENKEGRKKEWFHLFYYWMGEMLLGKLQEGKFSSAMENCAKEIRQLDNESTKFSMYAPDNEELFKGMKKLFDYKIDQEFMRTVVSPEGEHCPKEYQTYLLNVRTAYLKVYGACKSANGKGWCKDFEELYGKIEDGENFRSEYDLIRMVEYAHKNGALPKAESLKSNITDSFGNIDIPSYTFLGIATPLITFFFYKYISLLVPQGHKSPKGSGRRGKRSFVKREFDDDDTLTQNDDDSRTEYSTLGSTIYDRTDVSTIYDREILLVTSLLLP
ncbi:KIR protein [Plasmodium coatneyi]|uniref:KIR protein n=1 Tax=Plasmodium coatneyi TaxID=208452 RepID=A0A1B1E5Y2_9APIC|nr:KIR protein [Plasmodium coatneyi]ANQ10444.1 KIR protein [Plasmodium coatneyi]